MINPIASNDQFAAELDVASMWQEETVQLARAAARQNFDLAYGVDTPEEARPSFDAAIDEYVTNYLFKAAASDASHPRFVRDFMPGYDWAGRSVPGARMGGDNPDNCYRLAGIEHGGQYRVSGKPCAGWPANTSFTLVGNYGTSVTIQTIENHQLETAVDGSFVITIDDRPATGRRNHLTTAPNVKFLFVRDSMEDWAAEVPLQLKIERLDKAPHPPITVKEMARRAAFRLVEEVPLYYWFHRLFSGLPPNSLRPPSTSRAVGGLVTQAGVQGWYQLGNDEAVIVRYHPAGAAYASVTLGDWWFRTIDAHRRQSSLTRLQSTVGPDGWIECAIARKDPGVANWLDTGGLSTVLLFARWQGLPPNPSGERPTMEARVVPLSRIASGEFECGGTLDSKQRARQIEARSAAWQRRCTEKI